MPIKVDSPGILPYLAGLVDGEGYLGIVKRLPGRNKMVAPKYSERLSIAMCDPRPLRLIQRCFGIKRELYLRRRYVKTHRECFVFEVEHDKASEIINSLLPFLVVKREPALVVLEFNQLRTASHDRRTKPVSVHTFKAGRNKGTKYRVLGLSDEYLGRCELLYQRIRVINARGPRIDFANKEVVSG